MKKYLGLLLCFLASSLFAQQEKAVALLEKGALFFENSSGIEASFLLKEQEKGASAIHSFEGTLKNKGNRFYLSTPDVETWFDGTTQWSYLKNNEEVNITTPTPEETESVNPIAILRSYKKEYRVNYKGAKQIGTVKTEEVELIPKDKENIWSKIYLNLDPLTGTPVLIKLTNKNHQTTEIQFLKINNKLNLPDSTFVFNKSMYPDAELIDLR